MINQHKYVLLILFFLFNVSSLKSIDLVPILTLQKLATVQIALAENQLFNVVVDSGSQYFWVGEYPSNINTTNQYNRTSNFTDLSKDFSVKYNTSEVSGIIGEEYFSFPGSTNPFKMPFGLANSSTLILDNIDGILGFGRNYKKHKNLTESSDLLLQLKNRKLIDKRIFSIGYQYNNQTKALGGSVHIGNWPTFTKNATRNMKHTCKLLSEYEHQWTCKLSHFIIGNTNSFKNNSIEVNLPTIFNTGSSITVLPYHVLEFMQKKIDKSAECSIHEIGNYSHLHCKTIDNFPQMYFVFDKYALDIDIHNVFSYDNTEQTFILLYIFSKQENSTVTLGATFLKDYHLVFDGEENVVGFYNSTKNIHLADNSVHWFSYVLVVLLIIAEGLIALWFVYWCKRNKHSKDNDDVDDLIKVESLGEMTG